MLLVLPCHSRCAFSLRNVLEAACCSAQFACGGTPKQRPQGPRVPRARPKLSQSLGSGAFPYWLKVARLSEILLIESTFSLRFQEHKTALHHAASAGHARIVSLLIEAHADLNPIDKVSRDLTTQNILLVFTTSVFSSLSSERKNAVTLGCQECQ